VCGDAACGNAKFSTVPTGRPNGGGGGQELLETILNCRRSTSRLLTMPYTKHGQCAVA
jgi:hypothetical protein